jgi:hypothetical protein
MFLWRPEERPTAKLEGNKKAAEMVAYGMAVKVV